MANGAGYLSDIQRSLPHRNQPDGRPRATAAAMASLLILAFLASGCTTPLGDVDAANAPDPDTMPTVLDWEFEDCTLAVAILRVAPEALQPHLPEGFRSLSLGEVFGGGDTGDAVFGVEGFRCPHGQTSAGELHDVSFGFYWAAVEPPEALTNPDAWLHFVHWAPMTSDANWRNHLQENGVPVEEGHVDTTIGGTSTVRTAASTLTFGKHVHSLQGSAFVTNEALTAGAHIVHFQQTDAGLVTWTMHSKGESVLDGTASVELAAGSLPAQLAGSTHTAALLGTGTVYTLGKGTITMPA